MTTDPVCGKTIDEKEAMAEGRGTEHQERLYFFCSSKCKLQFHQAPYRYVPQRVMPVHERTGWFTTDFFRTPHSAEPRQPQRSSR